MDHWNDQANTHYDLIFQQSCDVVTEVNLLTGEYFQTLFSSKDYFSLPKSGSYQAAFEEMLSSRIVPEDSELLECYFSLEQLREASRGDCNGECHEFSLIEGDHLLYLESRVYFIRDKGSRAVITTRDITGQKTKEFDQQMAREYDIALRRIYDELYELNISQDNYRIIYHVADKYVTPPEQGVLTETIAEVADHMIHPEDRDAFLRFFDIREIRKYFVSGKECMLAEFRKLWTDGDYHWSSLTILPVKERAQAEEIYLCFIMDIGDKKRSDEIAEQNRLLKKQQLDDERYRIIVEQTGTMVFEWNRDSNLRYFSDEMKTEFSGRYDERDLLQIWRQDQVIHPEDLGLFKEFLKRIHSGGEDSEMTIRLKSKKGEFLWCKVALTCIRDEIGGLKRVIGTINNVDEAVRSEQTLKYRAEFDMLTGIHNRQAFDSHARLLMERHPDRKYAVIRMDINRFKFINDIYGIEEGDRLLQFIARTIQGIAGENDAYGRMEGDIFCMCCAYRTEEDLVALVKQIIKRLSDYNLSYKIVPSFGICTVDDRSVPVSILCDWANLALKTVKGNMVKLWAFYDDKLRAKQLDERNIENEMEQALKLGQFTVYLQPKHDIHTGKIVGAESLVRWNHPKEGIMTPYRFIPLFERNGFILQLDEYVWEETCRLLSSWISKGYEPIPISVNVSRVHVYNTGFCDRLLSLAQQYNLPRNLLELELTESTFIENPEQLYQTMERLQQEGFAFSMDDFGAGYSSLNMLKNAPVNTIKLDREFLNETVATQKGRTVIQYTISMAKRLNLKVVAEGVETGEQADFLLKAGCLTAQGYYFSKPMSIQAFEQLAFEKRENTI